MSQSEEFRRLKEEAERRIMAAEEEAHRGRGATVNEAVNAKSAAAQKLAILERTLAAKEYEIQKLQEEKQNAVEQCEEALLGASLAESLLKEYKTKTYDYDQLQAKIKEFEGADAKLSEYDSLVERLKALEEKEKSQQVDKQQLEQLVVERDKAIEENTRLKSEMEKLQTILISTSSHIKTLEAKYDKLKKRYKERKRKSDPTAQPVSPTTPTAAAAAAAAPQENGTTCASELERLQQENSKLKQTIEQEQKLRANQEESLSKLRIRQSLRIEVKVVRVIDTGFTPFGLCISNDGNVYIGNLKRSQSVIMVYRLSDGKKLKKISLGKIDDGVAIRAIALTSNNLMYVAFSTNSIRAYRLPDGTLVRQFGVLGRGKGQYDEIHGLAYDSKTNQLYVTDSCNNRVQVIEDDGQIVRTVGNTGDKSQKLAFPHAVTLDSKGRTIVSEYETHRIHVFSPDGTSLFTFGKKGSNIGEFNDPRGIAVDKNDNIIVCDYFNHRVQVFDSEGNFLHSFGSQGTKPGQFEKPRYAAFDPSTSCICVATDINDHRVQVLSISV